jgi:hypothetical protein
MFKFLPLVLCFNLISCVHFDDDAQNSEPLTDVSHAAATHSTATAEAQLKIQEQAQALADQAASQAAAQAASDAAQAAAQAASQAGMQQMALPLPMF